MAKRILISAESLPRQMVYICLDGQVRAQKFLGKRAKVLNRKNLLAYLRCKTLDEALEGYAKGHEETLPTVWQAVRDAAYVGYRLGLISRKQWDSDNYPDNLKTLWAKLAPKRKRKA
jgi:hypothetical protein